MTVAVVQARMGSARFPGKVLAPIMGRPVVERLINCIQVSGAFEKIIIATTSLPEDDVLESWSSALGVSVVRGSRANVHSRFVSIAKAYPDQSSFARFTADNPFVSRELISEALLIVKRLNPNTAWLVSSRGTCMPAGMDVEIFSRAAVQMPEFGDSPEGQEHVTIKMYESTNIKKVRVCRHGSPPCLLVSKVSASLDYPSQWNRLNEMARLLALISRDRTSGDAT